MKILSARRFAPLALGAALLVSGALNVANAQKANAGKAQSDLRTRTQQRVQNLFKTVGTGANELNLSAAQKAKISAIARKNAPAIKAIWSNGSLSQEAKLSKIRALKNETSAVLTTAQKQKMAQAKGQAMGKMFETALWVSNELDLTDQQQNKLKNVVFASYRKASGNGGDFGSLRGLLLNTSSQINEVLTPAQQRKWTVIQSTARQEIVKQTRSLRQMNRV